MYIKQPIIVWTSQAHNKEKLYAEVIMQLITIQHTSTFTVSRAKFHVT